MNTSKQLLSKETSKVLFPIFLIIYCVLASLAVNAQTTQDQSIISKQSENHIYQFLLTDKNNKYTSEIQVGQHLRSPEGVPIFNFNGTAALKQEPKNKFEKSGLGGIDATGYGNNNVTVQKIEPKTGKPYLIMLDQASFKTLSKNIN